MSSSPPLLSISPPLLNISSIATTMAASIVDLDKAKALRAELRDSSMGKVDDASCKNQTKMDIDAHMEKKLPETNEDMNLNCVLEAPVPLDNTSMKGPIDLQHKRKKKKKVSRTAELSRKPPVGDSLHKVNVTHADNQPKEGIIVKETVRNSFGFENESGITALITESSQPSNIKHVESLVQTNVNCQQNKKEKVLEVPSPSKLLNNTSSNLDSVIHEIVVWSGGLIDCDNTATDMTSKHEHIKCKSEENDPTLLISNDPALQISEEGVTNALSIVLLKITRESSGFCVFGEAVGWFCQE